MNNKDKYVNVNPNAIHIGDIGRVICNLPRALWRKIKEKWQKAKEKRKEIIAQKQAAKEGRRRRKSYRRQNSIFHRFAAYVIGSNKKSAEKVLERESDVQTEIDEDNNLEPMPLWELPSALSAPVASEPTPVVSTPAEPSQPIILPGKIAPSPTPASPVIEIDEGPIPAYGYPRPSAPSAPVASEPTPVISTPVEPSQPIILPGEIAPSPILASPVAEEPTPVEFAAPSAPSEPVAEEPNPIPAVSEEPVSEYADPAPNPTPLPLEEPQPFAQPYSHIDYSSMPYSPFGMPFGGYCPTNHPYVPGYMPEGFESVINIKKHPHKYNSASRNKSIKNGKKIYDVYKKSCRQQNRDIHCRKSKSTLVLFACNKNY